MPFGFWGTAAESGVLETGGTLYYVLVVLAGLVPLLLLYRHKAEIRGMTAPQWAAVVVLSGAALLFGRLFPLSLPWSDPILSGQSVTSAMGPFAAAPYLLAGAALNVPAAIIVGLFSGLARAFGQTHSALDIVGVAWAAGLAALMVQQHYSGRFFRLLRRPPVAGALGQLILSIFTGLHVLFILTPLTNTMAALDMALFISTATLIPLLIEGLVGGSLVVLLFWIQPQWRSPQGTIPSPFRRSLQGQIVGTYLTFVLAVILITTGVAFYLSTQSMSRSAIGQMSTNVDAAAVRLAALKSNLSIALTENSANDNLVAAGPDAKRRAIGRYQRTIPQFSAITLYDSTGSTAVAAGYELIQTSSIERHLVADVLASNQALMIADEVDGSMAVLIAVPIREAAGRAVLVGRLSPDALSDVAGLLPGATGPGYGLIVDERARVVLRSGDGAEAVITELWEIPAPDLLRLTANRIASGRQVYQTIDPLTGVRQFLYLASVPGSGWKIAAVVPHAVIMRQSMGVMGPVSLALLGMSLLFFLAVSALSRNISRPLADVAKASKAIASGGGLERPIRSEREDEIGQLSLAFSQMQRSLKQRLDELALLLGVSNQLAATVDMNEGMKAVLQGVLRGTGAAGVRAVVRNPVAPAPLLFAEGPSADSLTVLDRGVVTQLREVSELILCSPQEIQSQLGIEVAPVSALYAVMLKTASEFQGALIVAYRQPHYFDNTELNLLRTLAGQASVLVQNAHLFTAAENGRRRLAAILASTTNAVIVTDQTDRVLLLNPAMERALGLKAEEVTGRPVVDSIPIRELARHLSMGMLAASKETRNRDGKLELEANGRSYLANIATVQAADGQAMGRVAVLQDVTDFVEVDRMKSEFLAGISHDLKSPLTYMHNYAGMLPIDDDPALEREYIEKIMAGIDRMSLLVNDLVEMAQIQAGINLQFDVVQIGDILAAVAEEYASPALMQGVRLVVEVPDRLPPVLGDPALLRRAVTNYVTNGLKHAPNSGTMILSAGQQEDEIVISVRDNGPGIPFLDRAHLFEKFYRGHKAAGNTRGSGLGLAIVKSIADHHKGRVWCESRTEEGSVFYLSLPVASSEQAAISQQRGDR
jgi:PAS domain S-box-containing protein